MGKTTDRKSEVYKADSSMVAERVNTVYLLKLQGYTRKDIIQYCFDNYKVGDRQTDNYIEKATEIFKSNEDGKLDDKKFMILNQFTDLYQKNYQEQDFKECRNILKDIASVLGIEAPKKTELEINKEADFVLKIIGKDD